MFQYLQKDESVGAKLEYKTTKRKDYGKIKWPIRWE